MQRSPCETCVLECKYTTIGCPRWRGWFRREWATVTRVIRGGAR